MDISAAALPPIQPSISDAEKRHPRFNEYMAHRSAMSALLVTALSFDGWLCQTEETERAKEVVFNVNWDHVPPSERPDGALAAGWYKHRFAPGHRLIERIGPFAAKLEAEMA